MIFAIFVAGILDPRKQRFLPTPLFGSSPFAAPNSRSPPKFDHSLLFTLLLKYPRATLPHGRPRPRPNLEPPSPPTRPASPLPATTPCPLPTTHYPFSFSRLRALNSFASYHVPAAPAVSCDYALFCATARRYPSYFQWLPHSFYRHGGVPFIIPDVQTFGPANMPTLLLSNACRLFAVSCELPSFVFNRLEPLFQKHPGGGWVPLPQ